MASKKEEKANAPEVAAQTPDPERLPIVGEVVHYVESEGKHLVAAVHAVFAGLDGQPNGSLELRVHDTDNPDNSFRTAPVGHDEAGAPGTWHFPEPEPAAPTEAAK